MNTASPSFLGSPILFSLRLAYDGASPLCPTTVAVPHSRCPPCKCFLHTTAKINP